MARVMQVSRQAICRTPKRCTTRTRGRWRVTVDEAIVELVRENPTDGTRMVAEVTSRQIGDPVSRKRAQRVMRQHG